MIDRGRSGFSTNEFQYKRASIKPGPITPLRWDARLADMGLNLNPSMTSCFAKHGLCHAEQTLAGHLQNEWHVCDQSFVACPGNGEHLFGILIYRPAAKLEMMLRHPQPVAGIFYRGTIRLFRWSSLELPVSNKAFT